MWDLKQQEVIRKSLEVYKWAIDQGIAKEQARAVLLEELYNISTIYEWYSSFMDALH